MTRKSKTARKDDPERFKEWIVSRGAALMVPTNQYEVIRWRGAGGVSIIYQNARGELTFTGDAGPAWHAFKNDQNDYRVTAATEIKRRSRQKNSVLIRSLVDRDGDECFYCGDPFSDERPRTKEHLVPRTAGGPDHIANMFLSCALCNAEAGHLSAAQKIKMRDRKRRGRGSKLLKQCLDDALFPVKQLQDEIRTFLHESKPNGESQCLNSPEPTPSNMSSEL